MTQTIYKIEFPDGSFYIGATSNFSRRAAQHKAALQNGTGVNRAVQSAFNRHQALSVYPVASPLPGVPLHLAERAVIDAQRPQLNRNRRPHVLPAPGQWSGASAVARRYGVTPGVYYARRHNGWTLMEALGIRPRPKQGPKKVKPRLLTANGRTMPLNKWAAEIGVPPNVIHARLHAGWTEAEAVGAEKRPAQVEKERRAAEKAARKKPKLTYTVNGFTGTLPEICAKFGYNYPAANSRRRAGYPFETWFLSVDDFWRYGLAKRAVDAGRELPLALADLRHLV